MKNNNKGFIITIIIIALPLFIGCLIVLTSLIFYIRNHDLAQNICIAHTTSAQKKIKQELQALLKLTPLATKLRRELKSLQLMYEVALQTSEPITIATLQVKIKEVQTQRLLLNIKQKHILYNTVKIVNTHFYNFKKTLQKLNPNNITKKHHQPIPLAVIQKPKDDIAPSYYIKNNFSAQQTISFFWTMPLDTFLPQWIKDIYFVRTLSSYKCAATLKKIKFKWKTILTVKLIKLKNNNFKKETS